MCSPTLCWGEENYVPPVETSMTSRGIATVSPLAPVHVFVDGAGQNSNTSLRCLTQTGNWFLCLGPTSRGHSEFGWGSKEETFILKY